jgi:hypothetical protein
MVGLAAALLLKLASTGQSGPGPCPSEGTGVGTAALYGCVVNGQLVELRGALPGGGALALRVAAASSVEGCTAASGAAVELAAPRAGVLSATRRLTCPPDGTWHPNTTHSATVTDTFFAATPGASRGGPPALSWNASFWSAEPAMWTAPLSSSVSVDNVSEPTVWVGGPSSSKTAVSNTTSPLDPIRFGECDSAHHGQCRYWYGGELTDLRFHQNLITANQQGRELVDAPSMALPIATLLGTNGGAPLGLSFVQSARDHPVSMTLTTQQVGGAPVPPAPGHCTSKPQPCPSHKGHTFCPSNPAAGQCDKSPALCPPCPGPGPPPPPGPPGSSGGAFSFSRQYHRLGGGAAAVTFSQSLLLHEDCFRPALRWFDAAYPEVMRVDENIDRALVDGPATSTNYRGDQISAEAMKNSIATGVQVWNDLSEFQPFHGTWGPYSSILPGLKTSNSTQWLTCMPDKSSFNSGGPPPMPPSDFQHRVTAGMRPPPPPPSCWNPNYQQIKEWYSEFPKFAGQGKPFTYVNWFEYGWYSCPTCPAGGWHCDDFKPSDISAITASKANTAKVNQTLGCYSKWLVDTLNISHTQLYDPATMKPVVPPGCVGFSAVYDPGAEPYRTHLLKMLQAVADNLCSESGGT